MKILFATIWFLLFAIVANADQTVGRVGRQTEYVTAPVVHDATMRTVEDLSNQESYFLSTVPNTDGLRDAVCEMLLANVVHVPVWKVYRKGDSVHYWSIYQAWTGPHKVKVPFIRGLDGQDGRPGRNGRDGYNGRDGAPGPMGPQGLQGPATIITAAVQQPMYAIVASPQPYTQVVSPGASGMGGFVYAPSNSNFNLSATGGKGGESNITNNNANSNTNANANNTAINIGDGSASGSATGTGTGSAQAGSNRK